MHFSVYECYVGNDCGTSHPLFWDTAASKTGIQFLANFQNCFSPAVGEVVKIVPQTLFFGNIGGKLIL